MPAMAGEAGKRRGRKSLLVLFFRKEHLPFVCFGAADMNDRSVDAAHEQPRCEDKDRGLRPRCERAFMRFGNGKCPLPVFENLGQSVLDFRRALPIAQRANRRIFFSCR